MSHVLATLFATFVSLTLLWPIRISQPGVQSWLYRVAKAGYLYFVVSTVNPSPGPMPRLYQLNIWIEIKRRHLHVTCTAVEVYKIGHSVIIQVNGPTTDIITASGEYDRNEMVFKNSLRVGFRSMCHFLGAIGRHLLWDVLGPLAILRSNTCWGYATESSIKNLWLLVVFMPRMFNGYTIVWWT